LPNSRTLIENAPASSGANNHACNYAFAAIGKINRLNKQIEFYNVDRCYHSSVPGDGSELTCERVRGSRDSAIAEREQQINLAQMYLAQCNNNELIIPAERYGCEVSKVIDGDTFDCIFSNGSKETIRLIGIDAPELDSNDGEEAKHYLESVLNDSSNVEIELDVQERDKYGRLLAYVYIYGGTMLNKLLLEDGHATPKSYPPNTKYQEEFEATTIYR
jgi:endonuclease YncB( thermonuclease family)